jgi:hypothetical protein
VSGWLVDPVTRAPMLAIAGERPVSQGTAAHWRIERDESGMPVRMRFAFCDDPKCCPPLPAKDDR